MYVANNKNSAYTMYDIKIRKCIYNLKLYLSLAARITVIKENRITAL